MYHPFAKLPPFLRYLISACPLAGNGVNPWLYKVARHLHHHLSEADIIRLLQIAVEDCGRVVPFSEIQRAVRNSKAVAWTPSGTSASSNFPQQPRWPDVNESLIQAAANQSTVKSIENLTEESPVACAAPPSTEDIIDALFPGNPLLCAGTTSKDFWTEPREVLRSRLHRHSLIVPSAMRWKLGKVKSTGRLSAHTLDNTGPRQHLVTEFDGGTLDSQAVLIGHLKQFAPLTIVVHSGGKSLHAWWYCADVPEHELKRFMDYAVALGADPATWARSQFVRMPGGLRDGRTPQRVLYFDPDAGRMTPRDGWFLDSLPDINRKEVS
ncbi:MAG: hypothetical protein KF712_04100 [Akkermansiaceae bacterium]|nr:hypothetical protein [Akkermansiaceae bacterium]